MDAQNIMDLVKSINEETPSSSKLLSTKDMVLGKTRENNTLGKLVLKFVDLLQNTSDGVMHLDKATTMLDIKQKRRIYDVTNVLEGIGLIEKQTRNQVRWMGIQKGGMIALESKRHQAEIENLKWQEDILDKQLEILSRDLKLLKEEKSFSRYMYLLNSDISNKQEKQSVFTVQPKGAHKGNIYIPRTKCNQNSSIQPNNNSMPFKIHLNSKTVPVNMNLISFKAFGQLENKRCASKTNSKLRKIPRTNYSDDVKSSVTCNNEETDDIEEIIVLNKEGKEVEKIINNEETDDREDNTILNKEGKEVEKIINNEETDDIEEIIVLNKEGKEVEKIINNEETDDREDNTILNKEGKEVEKIINNEETDDIEEIIVLNKEGKEVEKIINNEDTDDREDNTILNKEDNEETDDIEEIIVLNKEGKEVEKIINNEETDDREDNTILNKEGKEVEKIINNEETDDIEEIIVLNKEGKEVEKIINNEETDDREDNTILNKEGKEVEKIINNEETDDIEEIIVLNTEGKEVEKIINNEETDDREDNTILNKEGKEVEKIINNEETDYIEEIIVLNKEGKEVEKIINCVTLDDNGTKSYTRVPPLYYPIFRLSPPPSVNTFPCLIDPSEGAFEAFDIKPK